jgi:hypothetical protein
MMSKMSIFFVMGGWDQFKVQKQVKFCSKEDGLFAGAPWFSSPGKRSSRFSPPSNLCALYTASPKGHLLITSIVKTQLASRIG